MFYCWAQEAASKITNRIVESNSAVPEVKICAATLRLMLQILNWDFWFNTGEAKGSLNVFSPGVRQDGDSPRRSECNLVQILISRSSSLLSESRTEKYKDLRALLQLLTSLCSKDMIDFSSDSIETQGTNISQVVYFGLHIVTPLVSMDLLKYPKLCHSYFCLLSHLLEVYPETFAQLNSEALAHVLRTLDFGLHHQDGDVVSKVLRALQGVASYHYKETLAGGIGLGAHATGLKDSNGNMQEGLLSLFLRSLLRLLLFEDYSSDLISAAADALLPLILCEQSLYQRLGNELIERQSSPRLRSRLANALHTLTSANQLSSSLDRMNYQRFRKNLNCFLIEVRGFLRTM